MSKGIDIELVRENYQQMSNEELISIATQDATGMTPEAQQILKEEIVKRKLDESMIQSVDEQNKIYTAEEIEYYCELARSLACPVCGISSSKLNGSLTSTVMSVIIFTQYSQSVKIACPECLDKANNSALSFTRIFGWWAIPSGVAKTIKAIEINKKSKTTNHLDTPNEYLRKYVFANIRQFERYKDDKQKLQELILEQKIS